MLQGLVAAVAAVATLVIPLPLPKDSKVVIRLPPNVHISKKPHALLSSPHKTLSFSVTNVHVPVPRPKKK
jgi:hypothetical protein